ncbi:hypothetical protein KFZ70_15870 [Tamlana fucoidanivorans]|uniref:Uncharacterized protein n=1 Tax=Allotamlana fucoidanivorans TaxID=2583814 RepID=A0A5C4SHR6_9FLAO|nr:hypothetical protein [Tamlana fucoidanivorans]TNJ42980.1 hypothetical protein FGF67_13405 [Tamlana fucoidanivorans]
MKTLKLIGITIIGLILMCACEKNNDELLLEEDMTLNENFTLKGDLGKVDNEVNVPFKATFTVWRALPPGTGECEEGSSRETMRMKGNGEMAHLGQLSEIFMTFCVRSDASYSFVESGKFVAANGDELHFTINEGQIVLNTGGNPDYLLYFNDDVIFIGGTGRFEGASGSAKTNAFVHIGTTGDDGDDPFYTDFFMNEGTLTLQKGN